MGGDRWRWRWREIGDGWRWRWVYLYMKGKSYVQNSGKRGKMSQWKKKMMRKWKWENIFFFFITNSFAHLYSKSYYLFACRSFARHLAMQPRGSTSILCNEMELVDGTWIHIGAGGCCVVQGSSGESTIISFQISYSCYEVVIHESRLTISFIKYWNSEKNEIGNSRLNKWMISMKDFFLTESVRGEGNRNRRIKWNRTLAHVTVSSLAKKSVSIFF